MIEANWHMPSATPEAFTLDARIDGPDDPRIALVQGAVREEFCANTEKQRAVWDEAIDLLQRSHPSRIVVHDTTGQQFAGGQAEWDLTILSDVTEEGAPVGWLAKIVAEKPNFTAEDAPLRMVMSDYVQAKGHENIVEPDTPSLVLPDYSVRPLTAAEQEFADIAHAAAASAERLIVKVRPLEYGVPDDTAPVDERWLFTREGRDEIPATLLPGHESEIVEDMRGATSNASGPITLREVYDYLRLYYGKAQAMEDHEWLADITARLQGETPVPTPHGLA